MLEHTRSLTVSGCCSRSYKSCQHGNGQDWTYHLLMKTISQTKSSSTCFKPHVISFGDICVTTTFTSAETNSLKTFTYVSHTHIHVCISEGVLYTNLLVHSTRLGTQRFPLLCLFQDLALYHMPFHLEIFVWRQSYFSRDQQPHKQSYDNHITYVNIHIHVCLSECMLYTH